MFAHVLIQLAPFCLLAAGIVACTFISLKKEIFSLKKRIKERQGEFQALKDAIATEMNELRIRLQEARNGPVS